MEEQLIAFETAKIAKVKGFDEKCSFSYKDVFPVELYQHEVKKYNNSWKREWGYTTRKNSDMINAKVNRYSAPTQSLLQRWLREKHELHIEISFGKDKTYVWYEIGVFSLKKPKDGDSEDDYDKLYENLVNLDNMPSYEEALEAGLQKALKSI